MIFKTVAGLFRAPGPEAAPAPATIELGGIAIEVVRKNIRNIHLRVCPPNGHVRISAPLRMNLEVIRSFAISRVDWVRKHQQRMGKSQGQTTKDGKGLIYFNKFVNVTT